MLFVKQNPGKSRDALMARWDNNENVENIEVLSTYLGNKTFFYTSAFISRVLEGRVKKVVEEQYVRDSAKKLSSWPMKIMEFT